MRRVTITHKSFGTFNLYEPNFCVSFENCEYKIEVYYNNFSFTALKNDIDGEIIVTRNNGTEERYTFNDFVYAISNGEL